MDIKFKKKVAEFIIKNGDTISTFNIIYFYYYPSKVFWICWLGSFLMSSKMHPIEQKFSMSGFDEQDNFNKETIETFIDNYDTGR